jgi:hypothetical protein
MLPKYILDKTVQYYERMHAEKVKINGIHFPSLGLLSYIGSPEQMIPDIQTAYTLLKEEQAFTGYNDMCLVLAIKRGTEEKLQDSSIFSIGTAISIQAIIQAQQEAITASISAAAASRAGTN